MRTATNIFLIFVCAALAFALSTTKPAGTGTGSGWTNPSNVTADDGNSATRSAANPLVFNSTNFGFALPSTDVIDSITVRVDNWAETSPASTSSLQLIKAGTPVGTDNAAWLTWTGSEATTNLSGGLWGTTWTADDINNSGFGVAIDAITDGDPADFFLEYVEITVYHSGSSIQRSPTGGVGYSSGGFIF